jgi:hypothetical protein
VKREFLSRHSSLNFSSGAFIRGGWFADSTALDGAVDEGLRLSAQWRLQLF